MASKKSLLEKAGGDMAKFFTGSETKADQQEDTRKPLNDTEKAVLEKYNGGMTVQTEIAAAIGKDKATVSRALSHIKNEYPELLQEPDNAKEATKQPEKPTEATKPAETIESKPEPEKPQETAQEQPQKPVKKQVFSFRAGINDISRWKAYSTATGQTMESVGNAAMTEYLKNHPLKNNEKVVYDALTANIDK